ARVHRAVLAYEIFVNERLWFERQIESARHRYRDYVVSSFTPPPAARFQLHRVDAIYVGQERGQDSGYDQQSGRVDLEPDDQIRDDRTGSWPLTDSDLQWILPHEYGHHVFAIGHPGYNMPSGTHWADDDEARRCYFKRYLADNFASSPAWLLWLIDR